MTGIILCGGQSSRMGSDKGLLKLEANTWAQTAVDKLSILGIPVKLSVNRQQLNDYAKVFAADDLFVDAASLELHGPLLGYDAYVFMNDHEPEPLCAIYTAKGLAVIFEMLQNGSLTRHSMKFMLDHLTVFSIQLNDAQKTCFRNFNAHAELNGL